MNFIDVDDSAAVTIEVNESWDETLRLCLLLSEYHVALPVKMLTQETEKEDLKKYLIRMLRENFHKIFDEEQI
eukprot:snap_masked-scaffold_1-processed-gene-9.32-mRNA-1 protein AED:1.00 eAED:1.00 QI:0/0/0/0/1/1/2/0/72